MDNQQNLLHLNNPQTLETLKNNTREYLTHYMHPEARALATLLESSLNTQTKNLTDESKNQYLNILVALKLLAIGLYDTESFLKLIREKILYAVDIGLDLEEILTPKLYGTPVFPWMELSQKIIYALKDNQQKIGREKILIHGDSSPSYPTLTNWLADLDRIYGPEKQDGATIRNYLAQNLNVAKLDTKEKNKLAQIIKLYNDLKPFKIPEEVRKKIEQLEKQIEQNDGIPSLESPNLNEQREKDQKIETFLRQASVPKQPKEDAKQTVHAANDQYLEPIEEKDIDMPKTGPRTDKPVIDLKNIKKQ